MSDMIQARRGEKILLTEYPDGFMDGLNARLDRLAHPALLTFSGRDNRGIIRNGQTTEFDSPAFLAAMFHKAGWRALKVVRDGLLVGGVDLHPRSLVRKWWGDRA